MIWSDKSVFVTRGTGLIGSHLLKKLLDLGSVVSVTDDFSARRRKNIEPFLDEIKLQTVDSTKLKNCSKAKKDMDYVFHLVARTNKPKSTWRNNSFRRPQRQLHNCRKYRSKRIHSNEKGYSNAYLTGLSETREKYIDGGKRQHINCLFLEINNMINTMLSKMNFREG